MRKITPRQASRRSHVAEEWCDPVAGLVRYGLRGWMLGAQSADLRFWEAVWNRYCGLMGPVQARCVVTELEGWTRKIDQTACRKIHVECLNCDGHTNDEQLAVSIIAAAQHGTCPAMRACAFALLDNANVDPMLDHAQSFAEALKQSDQVLAPWSVCSAFARPMPGPSRMH